MILPVFFVEFRKNIILKAFKKVNIVELHEIIILITHIIFSWNSYKELHEGVL